MAKSLVMGTAIGLSAWMVIFQVVIPSMNKIIVPLGPNLSLYTFANQITGITWLIVAGSAIFHIFYGLVYGNMMSILIRYKSRLYLCTSCSMKFTSRNVMDKYNKDNNEWFLCDRCKIGFRGELSYLKHMEEYR
jgi:hypothetical protein